MDQIQQLHELFLTYDSDKDGEVNGNEVYHILADMKIDYIYQGSVTKVQIKSCLDDWQIELFSKG